MRARAAKKLGWIILPAAVAAVWFLVAGRNSGPTPAVPPETPVPLAIERYPDGVLFINGVDPAEQPVTIVTGREYEYSGSFRLGDPGGESRRLEDLIVLQLLVDLEGSGFEPPDSASGEEPSTEVIVGQDLRPEVTIDADNVVHFDGLVEGPAKTGEVEVRVSVTDMEEYRRLPVVSRHVKVVAAAEAGE